MELHKKYLKRCIELAQNGLGNTYPNPLVGSVIVFDDKIIGEGWHQKQGTPHAEVNAINAVKNKSLLKKATIYVNLEPCSHFGKTPPCADLILKYKIPNIVIGTLDPNKQVAGKGIKKLIEAGANVTLGVLETECNELNKRFFTFHTKQRPYIILKWAESNDGFIAPLYKKKQEPVWLTNIYSRQLVHKWRSEEQSILVGTQTVIDDNPKLNTRDWTGKSPIRLILDPNNRICKTYNVFDNSAKTIFFTKELKQNNFENIYFQKINFDENIITQICDFLYQNQIQSVIIEGGLKTLTTFIKSNIWDEALIFKTDSFLSKGIKAPKITTINAHITTILNNQLLTIKNNDATTPIKILN